MSFFKEIKAVLTQKDLLFREVHKEDDETYSFIFEPSKPLNWNAGQHAMFIMKHRKVEKGTRIFSIASSPLENKVMITTKIGEQPSDYKKALLELKVGTKIALRGPMGGFYLDLSKPACLITGGIGITPFKSMLKNLTLSQSNFNKKVTLLYINSKEPVLFEEELKTLSKGNNIQIEFFKDREMLTERIIEMAHDDQETIFFLSGPKQMTASVKTTLLAQSVNKKNIKADTFLGY